jgi:hypothetical protein
MPFCLLLIINRINNKNKSRFYLLFFVVDAFKAGALIKAGAFEIGAEEIVELVDK